MSTPVDLLGAMSYDLSYELPDLQPVTYDLLDL
jgi:hypothetical protein